MTFKSITFKIAQSQNGVQEVPRNSNVGAAVESYLKVLGLVKVILVHGFWLIGL